MNRDRFKLAPTARPYTNGPLIPNTEMTRTADSYHEYTLTEEQRQAIIEQYGPPIMELRSNRTHYQAKGRKG